MPKIGEILIKKGLVTQEQMDVALKECARIGGEVTGKTLVRLKFITQEQLLQALAEQLGLQFHPSLQEMKVHLDVIKAVPAKFVWHYKFMPLAKSGNNLTIAVSDPLAVWPMEDLKMHLGFSVERVLSTENEIQGMIRKYYGIGAETVEEIMSQDLPVPASAFQHNKHEELQELEKNAEDASVIKLVNQIFTEAVASRATDIHIEIYQEKVRVRYRIDGILYDMRVPEQIRHLHQAIVSRIKIISSLNVVEKRVPQDGRAIIKIHDKQVDLRVSVIPTLYGENVVIRILPVHLLFNLEDLGFSLQEREAMDMLMKRPHGIVFMTGPTGSGKTTTLYACLFRLNKEGVKIITIEDPIEYELPGVMQIQVKPEIGMTFANALRSILRHDPDIMMVGEVRDLETAELAIRTALTGHLIFSTLHTNDACSGATRLLDIGIEPYLIASSVNAFISQRLVRLICPECKTEMHLKEGIPEELKGSTVYCGKGCDQCNSIGYKGRTAIYEIMLVNEAIQELILRKASVSQILKKAREYGFRTLRESGIELVKKGLTTPEEVLRVTETEHDRQ